jgi:hypothetical protein
MYVVRLLIQSDMLQSHHVTQQWAPRRAHRTRLSYCAYITLSYSYICRPNVRHTVIVHENLDKHEHGNCYYECSFALTAIVATGSSVVSFIVTETIP